MHIELYGRVTGNEGQSARVGKYKIKQLFMTS